MSPEVNLASRLEGASREVGPYIGQVARAAGIGFELDTETLSLDFRSLDEVAVRDARSSGLRTLASLILRDGEPHVLRAHLPSQLSARRALDASGVTFALADRRAELAPPSEGPGQIELIDEASSALAAWRTDFSPAARDWRNGVFGEETNRRHTLSQGPFLALVNFHRRSTRSLLAETRRSVGPWLAASPQDDIEALGSNQLLPAMVEQVLEIVMEAAENVALHAFLPTTARRRSLLTLRRSSDHHERRLTIQILDNGCGLAQSIARKSGCPDGPDAEVRRVVDELLDPLHERELSAARGRGVIRMFKLAHLLGGSLDVISSAPGEKQLRLTSKGSRPAQSVTDIMPVQGTIVTLTIDLISHQA